jgi:exosome complex component CSL4
LLVVSEGSVPDGDDISYTNITGITDDERQFQAVLRREDVRTHEKDKIVMNDMYRVGDIVRATVISLGDERNYYINTAGNELGVVVATSEAGNAMVPTSWREMKDVVTGRGENRKVAKPS